MNPHSQTTAVVGSKRDKAQDREEYWGSSNLDTCGRRVKRYLDKCMKSRCRPKNHTLIQLTHAASLKSNLVVSILRSLDLPMDRVFPSPKHLCPDGQCGRVQDRAQDKTACLLTHMGLNYLRASTNTSTSLARNSNMRHRKVRSLARYHSMRVSPPCNPSHLITEAVSITVI